MNKKPLLLRWSFAVVVIIVFTISIYPLFPRNFYETFRGALIEKDKKIEDVFSLAKKKQEKDKNLYASTAIEEAADELNVDLTKYVKAKGVATNRDVISLIRQKASASIRLGLDLAGGAEFLLELVPDKPEKGEKDAKETDKDKPASLSFDRYRDIAIEILRNRLESQNIYESEISPSGQKLISLRIPIVSKDEKIKLLNLIQMSAKLEFRLVHKDNELWVNKYQKDPSNIPVGYEKMTMMVNERGKKPKQQIYFVQIRKEMDGKNIVKAGPYLDQFGRREIQLQFNAEGARQFADVTRENVGRLLAIVLDGKLYSAPRIKQEISGGHAVITGDFSREEAENISNALVSGSLPVRINVEAVFDTDPTIGASAVKSGAWAGAIALVVVMVFMICYYLAAGVIADIALGINIVLVLGALAAFQATLTLPGIAGIILTMGMSVDANVLIFERIREELKKNKTLVNAIDTGYSRAFTTILDANLTTLFVALILMWQGTGAIKGFAVTLSIGIITSFVTALFLTRLIFDTLTNNKLLKNLKMFLFFDETTFDFLNIRYITGGISVFLVLVTLVIAGIKGKDILGIDFTGGTQIVLTYSERVEVNKIKAALKKLNYQNAKVSYKTSAAIDEKQMLEIIIPDKSIATEKGKQTSPMTDIVALLNKDFPDSKFGNGRETSIGGLIGLEFTKSAIIAMILAIIGIIIYISLRFEFTFAIASIIALVHDVIIATGVYIVCGRELSLPVIAALLTIIGYSLNDTIVVFDRIREDLELVKNKSYLEIINLSINQTLSRTLLTSLTTLLVLLVLLFFGGVAINNFVFVMLTGVIVGTYSSIFVASPIVAFWHKRIGVRVKDS